MVLRRSTITLRELLVQAKHLPLKDVPYGRAILFYLPSDIPFYPTDTAQDLLEYFNQKGESSYIDQPLDEFLGVVESNLKRRIFRVAAWIALIGSTAFMVLIGYLSYVKQEFPGWDLISLAMGGPVWLMLDRFGAVTGEKLKKAGSFIKNFRKKKTPVNDYDDADYPSNPRDDYGDGSAYNSNPYSQDDDSYRR